MFWQVFIRSTTCRLNSTVCPRHFFILAILPPFDAKCVYSRCLKIGVHSIKKQRSYPCASVSIRGSVLIFAQLLTAESLQGSRAAPPHFLLRPRTHTERFGDPRRPSGGE